MHTHRSKNTTNNVINSGLINNHDPSLFTRHPSQKENQNKSIRIQKYNIRNEGNRRTIKWSIQYCTQMDSQSRHEEKVLVRTHIWEINHTTHTKFGRHVVYIDHCPIRKLFDIFLIYGHTGIHVPSTVFLRGEEGCAHMGRLWKSLGTAVCW